MRRSPGAFCDSRESKPTPEACASRCRTVDPSGPAGSSSPNAPSSTASSTAYADSSLVTLASSKTRVVSPNSASVSPTSAAATLSTGQSPKYRASSMPATIRARHWR